MEKILIPLLFFVPVFPISSADLEYPLMEMKIEIKTLQEIMMSWLELSISMTLKI